MKWYPFEYEGRLYSVSHLDPFEWSYTTKDEKPRKTYKFYVLFSMHCFTRNPIKGEQPSKELLYRSRKEERVFCFERYHLSMRLPEIIRNLNERQCYHTNHECFFTIEILSKENGLLEYEIYFDVSRAEKRGYLRLFVKSAYVRSEEYKASRPKKRKIHFDVISYNKQNKKPIKKT